jgi:cytosine/adenosine deaminase-related metal-dependent hydrolase
VSESRTYTARWVFPVSGPPLPNGTVTVRDDRIEAVQPLGERTADENLGNAAIIPGLVNPHTHLDLSGARGQIPPTPPDHFTDWLRGVIAYRRSRTAEQTQADIRAGLSECLHFGTTLIGDIAAEGTSWEPLAASRVRAVVFRELIGLADEQYMLENRNLSRWQQSHANTLTCRTAASPHAPYSVHSALIRTIAWNGWMLTVHLAESPAEIELLEHRTGPFREFLEDLGVWHPANIAHSLRWVLWRTQRSPNTLLAHCNYLPHSTKLKPNQSVVYCPRTHAAFGHPPHPFREFLARGVRVCLGTDSLASNPDLDILAEARFVRSHYPDFPGDQLLRMVTLSGAEALGWSDECGSLEAGKSADFVAVPLPNAADASDPHELLLVDHPGERRTLFRGAWRN